MSLSSEGDEKRGRQSALRLEREGEREASRKREEGKERKWLPAELKDAGQQVGHGANCSLRGC